MNNTSRPGACLNGWVSELIDESEQLRFFSPGFGAHYVR